MQLIPEIKTLTEKKLVGNRMRMCLAENKTPVLWKSFMPRRNEITNGVNDNLFSMQVYDKGFNINELNLQTQFDKWALREVSNFNQVPEGMETFTLQSGLYAVFHYKGDASNAPAVFRYIFGTWIPSSEYIVDDRPHFEILGEKYKRDDPGSEEEIWIPIRKRD